MKLKRVLALALVLFITLATSSVLAQGYNANTNNRGIPKCPRKCSDNYYVVPRVVYPIYYSYPIVRTSCAQVTIPSTSGQVTVCSKTVVYPYVPVLYVYNPSTYQVVPLYMPYRAPDIDYVYPQYSGCKKFR